MDKLLLTKCLGCMGAVIYEKFYGSHDQFSGWKCLICGEIIGPVIIEDRQSFPTLQEIGNHFKLSRERVRQIESEALEKLRKEMSLGPRTEGLTGGREHAYL